MTKLLRMNPHVQLSRVRKRRMSAAAVVCAGLFLSSCATDDNGSDDSSAPNNAAMTTSENSESSSSQNLTPNGMGPGKSTCATDNLEISTSDTQGAAGSILLNVVLKNTGQTDCLMEGFPGVSLVSDNNGTQLGKAADREKEIEPQPVNLAPGASATAAVKITNVGALDQDKCQPTPADGLRVYPPNETKAAFVPLEDITGCSSDVSILSVQPVTVA